MLDKDPEPPHPFRLELAELPQPNNPMPPTLNAAAPSFSPEFDRTIFFPRLLMELAQQGEQPLILNRPLTRWSISPGIIATATDIESRAETRDSMRGCVSPDKRVFHVDSLAKYVAAFFKMSRSSVTRANSRRRRASAAAGSACRPDPGNAPPWPATSFCHL